MPYKHERNYENLQKASFAGVGAYGIPEIELTQYDGMCEFIGFNYAARCEKRTGKGIHFFLDDYQFARVWNSPDFYIGMLKDFKYVLTPDFSLFTDYPKALQLYNHYRKHWLGRYWQMHGIQVIPTICWSDEESFEWCFDGEPVGGVVAVSAMGSRRYEASRDFFMIGYEEMVRRLEPTQVIFYGDVPEGCQGNIIQIPAFTDKWRRKSNEA